MTTTCSPTGTKHHQCHSLPALEGWVLEKALAAERASGFPVLTRLLEAQPSRRDMVVALLALWSWPEIEERLSTSEGPTDPSVLFDGSLRPLCRRVIGRVPGIVGAVHRIGAASLQRPEDYRLLLDILTTGTGNRKKVLAHLSPVTSQALRALATLDEAFVRVGVTEWISDDHEASQANAALAFLRRRSSADLGTAKWRWLLNRFGASGLDAYEWLILALGVCGDRMPPGPLPERSGLRHIDTGRDFVALGREWHNCMASKVLDAANGKSVFYLAPFEGDPGSAQAVDAIVELSRYRLNKEELWLIASITVRYEREETPGLVEALKQRLARYGIGEMVGEQDKDAWSCNCERSQEARLLTLLREQME